MDNRLDYLDQAFFLSLRALNHGPIGQHIWIYGHDVDLDALRRFNCNLGRGPMGRLIQRSRIPFGRHSWVAWQGPADIEVSPTVRPRSEIGAWLDEQAQVWVDPEYGPAWRLAVQPLSEGGAVVTLVISHTVSDGGLALMAMRDASKGVTRDFGYPAANSRTKSQALLADLRATVRSFPDVVKALVAIPLAAKDISRWQQSKTKSASTAGTRHGGSKDLGRTVTYHSAVARVGIEQWDRRAESLGGTSNSLFLAVVARLGESLNMVTTDGMVNFAITISERAEGDTRGNALNGVTLTVDPTGVTADLTAVRAGLKSALSALADDPNAMAGPMALTPFIPKIVARGVERAGVKNMAVNCSNLGNLDPAINRPDGTDADFYYVRGRWVRLNCHTNPLALPNGFLFPVASGRLNGTVFVSVSYVTPDKSFTRQRLSELLDSILTDFGFTAIMGVTPESGIDPGIDLSPEEIDPA